MVRVTAVASTLHWAAGCMRIEHAKSPNGILCDRMSSAENCLYPLDFFPLHQTVKNEIPNVRIMLVYGEVSNGDRGRPSSVFVVDPENVKVLLIIGITILKLPGYIHALSSYLHCCRKQVD